MLLDPIGHTNFPSYTPSETPTPCGSAHGANARCTTSVLSAYEEPDRIDPGPSVRAIFPMPRGSYPTHKHLVLPATGAISHTVGGPISGLAAQLRPLATYKRVLDASRTLDRRQRGGYDVTAWSVRHSPRVLWDEMFVCRQVRSMRIHQQLEAVDSAAGAYSKCMGLRNRVGYRSARHRRPFLWDEMCVCRESRGLRPTGEVVRGGRRVFRGGLLHASSVRTGSSAMWRFGAVESRSRSSLHPRCQRLQGMAGSA